MLNQCEYDKQKHLQHRKDNTFVSQQTMTTGNYALLATAYQHKDGGNKRLHHRRTVQFGQRNTEHKVARSGLTLPTFGCWAVLSDSSGLRYCSCVCVVFNRGVIASVVLPQPPPPSSTGANGI